MGDSHFGPGERCDAHNLLAQRLRSRGEHDAAEAIEAAAQIISALGANNAKLSEALGWYQEQTEALARHLSKINQPDAVMACVTTLSLDGGKRAREALNGELKCGLHS